MAFLDSLIELGVVKMTQPDSPNSPTRRYRLTEAGKELLKIYNMDCETDYKN